MWAWGELRVFPGGFEQVGKFIDAVSEMGPEPLSQGFSPSTLITSGGASSKRAVKCLLLDQSVVAGVGNIYADESLYRAGVHPARRCGKLTDDDWVRLYSQVQAVIGEAVGLGGTVSDNFVDAHGKPGRYVPEVYGRAGQECKRCGSKLQRIKVCGRGTVFCSHCQPE
jgi:formamidopyrimidine-DNA glycosylase